MTSDLGTLYAALQTALISTADSTPSWGTRAYADFVPKRTGTSDVTRPYVVYSFAAGGDLNGVQQADPVLVFDCICVADSLSAALTGDAEIRARLDDRGEMEAVRTVIGDASYMLKTITHEQRIHFVEQVSGATQIYHSGGRYRAQLEKR